MIGKTKAFLGFLHLSTPTPASVGSTLPGGSSAGITGWPLDPKQGFGVAGPTNAHLAVIYDPLTERFT